MLKDWKAFAGYMQSGANKGKPIVMNKLDKNALCVLKCYPQTVEAMDVFLQRILLTILK
jgi:hypothetical protein